MGRTNVKITVHPREEHRYLSAFTGANSTGHFAQKRQESLVEISVPLIYGGNPVPFYRHPLPPWHVLLGDSSSSCLPLGD